MARRKSSKRRKGKNIILALAVILVVAAVAMFDNQDVSSPISGVKAAVGRVGNKVASLVDEGRVGRGTHGNIGHGAHRVQAAVDGLEMTIVPANVRSEIVRHTGYVVSHNSKLKVPNWVGYELTEREVNGTNPRDDDFQPDPDVKGHKAQLADYKGSGYDRGHMAPAADMKWSKKVMRESFYLSNMCPQDPSLNRGDWNDLEEKVRKWARRDSAIVVVCGPILSKRPETIGRGKVAVPKAFFKVILSPYSQSPSAIGFVMPNTSGNNPLRSYAMTVDEVERLTSFDFFSALPDSLEDAVEAKCDLKYWNL